jgi:hypothetical protein
MAMAVPLLLVSARAAAQTPESGRPAVTVGSLVYAQYGYRIGGAPAAQPAPNAFDITRAYIDVRATVPGGIGLRITSDVFRSRDTTSNDDGSLSLRLKYGYAAYTPGGSPITLKLGLIHTPWLDWVEGMYGYRMQGTMAIERAGYFNSADIGVGVDGAWAGQAVNLQVGIYNGEGYHGGAGDGRKDLEGRVSVRLVRSDDGGSRGGLRVTAYGHYGKPTSGGRRYRAIGMVSYHSRRFTLAAQGAIAGDSTTEESTSLLKGRIWSGFGVYRVPETPVAILARADLTDRNIDLTGDREVRVIGGVSYDLSTAVRLLLDLDSVDYQDARPTLTTALFQMQFAF